MPVDINRLTEGWLELESDPGLFTLLLEDFGVKGVQVEEIYDLQKSLDSPVYGFIFLFRWIEERRSRRKVVDQSDIYVKEEEVVNNIFFAQQMVPNSCATHSLLSVLLNCPNIHLGSTLSRLKAHTHGMCPENKGWAIGNTPELARAHNSHAMPQAKRRLDKSTGISTGRFTGEAYHFVSYVPINGRLFELDGLKPYPMDHGPWNESEDWTDKFHSVIADRLGIAAGDIRFNLMAVVPDKRLAITHKLNMLKTNRQIVLEALQQLVKLNHPDLAVKSEKESKGKSDDSKVSPGSKRKESNKALENGLDSLASIEDVLDLATPNKMPRKHHSPRKNNSATPEEKDGKGEKCDDVDENLKASPVNSCESLERHNLSKISLIVTSDENEQIKPEIPDSSKAGEKMPDYSTPLTIQTSPAPSTSSTDTSSEVGSAFNSPTQAWGWNSGQSSPNNAKDFKKFVVIRVAMAGSEEKMDSPTSRSKRDSLGVRKVCLEAGALPKGWEKPSSGKVSGMKISPLALSNKLKSDESGKKIETPHHTFAPKDLLALLKNLEGEISLCEGNLRDENEKRKKYKVDDCRRTHNYDEFICTFLSMLAQQGKLADLVQQHLMFQKKPGIQPPRPPVVKPTQKKHDAKNHSAKRRKGGAKHRKRK